jgi:two-component sensor histidine kinase
VISSLLNIQSRYIEDKQTISIFKESQNRIQSMALIHEKLYQSKDLIKVDFAHYIRNLAMNLFHCYNVSSDLISLNINVNNVSLNINTAIPCGLITNELVSNALKYAFKENVPGKIYIKLSLNEDKIFTLVVEDNGIGLAERIDMKNPKSLGLRLVITLVEQLKGNIEVDTSHGTIFKITFKELN